MTDKPFGKTLSVADRLHFSTNLIGQRTDSICVISIGGGSDGFHMKVNSANGRLGRIRFGDQKA
jgi:hypothetical protein